MAKRSIYPAGRITEADFKNRNAYNSLVSTALDNASEHAIQVAIFKILDFYETKFPEFRSIYAVPNGGKLPYVKKAKGKTHSPERVKLVAEGLKPGIPDICIPYTDGIHSSLYIEMKRSKSSKVQKSQKEMQQVLMSVGCQCITCYSSQEAMKCILEHTVSHYNWRIVKVNKDFPEKSVVKIELLTKYFNKIEELREILLNKSY